MVYKKRKIFKILYILILFPFIVAVVNLVSIALGNTYSGSIKVIPTNITWIIFFVLINIFILISKLKGKYNAKRSNL